MRLRNRATRARRGIALGWVLAILAILVIAIVVWLSARPGPAAPDDGNGAGPPVEEEEAAPEEPEEAPADEPEEAGEADEAEEAEAPAEEPPDDAEEAEADVPEEGEAPAEETEPEAVEAEVDTPEETAALFQEGDRQVDAADPLEEATQRLTRALQEAETGMRDLEPSETPEADVGEAGEMGASDEDADEATSGARVTEADASLPSLGEHSRTWMREPGEEGAPEAQISLGTVGAQPADDARVRTPELSLPSLGERTRTWTEEPRMPPDGPEGNLSLDAPGGDDASQRVRSAEDVGAQSQDALQRARQQVGEGQPRNDDAGAP